MKPENFRLLFHHHDITYPEGPDKLWLTSGIGRWLSALAPHFREIGLLLHESKQRSSKQDFILEQKNVKLISFGNPGYYLDHFSKIQRIRKICQQAGQNADGLLIRGLTPRQYDVWKYTSVPNKAFLLVRSPKQNRLVNFRPLTILSWLVNLRRESEFEKIIHKNTLMLANSPLHVQELSDLFGRNAYFVPTNTIREAEFLPLQVRPLSQPVRLFFCGRINVLKGVRELLQAVASLKQQEINCRLDIAGSGDDSQCTEFQNFARQLGLEHQVVWHGHVPFGNELLNLYRQADMFVLPTYTEGFPRVIWEAAASCCPVIATSVGGIPALIKDEHHGLLIPPKDADAIVSAVKRVLTEATLREKLVKNAHALAKNFSVESCARQMVIRLSEEWS